MQTPRSVESAHENSEDVEEAVQPDPPFKKSWAVVIGIDKYGNSVPELQTAVNDAKQIAETLTKVHGYDSTNLLTDAAASKEGIATLLRDKLPNLVEEDHCVLFYFAGHGLAIPSDKGPNGYLLPSDASLGIEPTYLRMTDVYDWLTALKCRHMLIVLDSCFAGAFQWSGTRDAVPPDTQIKLPKYNRYVSHRAWQVIASASRDQKALDQVSASARGVGKKGHSPFALALLTALVTDRADVGGASDGPGEESEDIDFTGENNADDSTDDKKERGDGVVTAEELFFYLDRRVQNAAEDVGKRQVPKLWELTPQHDGGQFVFFVKGRIPKIRKASKLSLNDNPWRGLKAYEKKDAGGFFGRAKEITRLRAHVEAQPLTVVLGASGAGKSSLVQAGLLPALPNDQWNVLPVIRPGTFPRKALAHAVFGEQYKATREMPVPTGRAVPTYEEIGAKVAELLAEQKEQKVALVIDRFEELITLSASSEERNAFLATLVSLRKAHQERLRLIITVRSDFEPGFLLTAIGNVWKEGVFRVAPMSRDDLRAVIEGPAAKCLLYFEPSKLVGELVAEVDATPGALPLLSFALSELYIRYMTRIGPDQEAGVIVARAITAEDYNALGGDDGAGGVVGALRKKADEVYRLMGAASQDAQNPASARATQVHPAQQALVAPSPLQATLQHLMLRMVVREGGNLAGRRVTIAELVFPDKEENDRREDVVNRMVSAGLWVPASEQGEEFVAPAHDALVREWPLLQRWVAELDEASKAAASRVGRQGLTGRALRFLGVAREAEPFSLRDRQNLTRAAGEYADATKQGKETPDLWVGRARSAQLAHLVKSHAKWLNKREVDFAESSAQRRFWNDSISLGAGVAITTLLSFVIGLGVTATVLAARATLRQLVAATTNALESGSLDRAALLAVEASTLPVPEVRSPVLTWQLTTPRLHGYLRDPSSVNNIAMSPDGNSLASAGERDSTVALWDANSRERARDPRVLEGRKSQVLGLAYSPDKRTLAVASADGAVVLWDVAKRDTLETLPRVTPRGTDTLSFSAVTFSPDGKMLAKGEDNVIVLWDVRSGQPPAAGKQGGRSQARYARVDPKPQHTGADAESTAFKNISRERLRSRSVDTLNNKGAVHSITFSPDGKTLASVSDAGVRLWRITRRPKYVVDSGETYWCITHPTSQPCVAIDSSRGVNKKAWQRIYQDNRADALSQPHWIFPGDSLDMGVDTRADERLAGKTRNVEAVAFSPDSQTFAVAPGGVSHSREIPDTTVILWDVANWQPRDTLPGHTGGATSVAFSPRRGIVATGTADGTVILWDISEKGHPKRIDNPLHGHTDAVTGLSFRSDGQVLVSASEDGKVIVWNSARSANTATTTTDLPRRPGSALVIALSPNDSAFASEKPDGAVIVRTVNRQGNWTTGVTLPLEQADTGSTIVFSPDGKYVAFTKDRKVALWDVAKGQSILSGRGPFTGLAFSPDSNTLAAAGDSLLLRDVKRGREKPMSLRSNDTSRVRSVAFSSRGWIAAGYSDGWIYARRGGFPSIKRRLLDFFEHPGAHVTYRWTQLFGRTRKDSTKTSIDPDDKIFKVRAHDGPVSSLAYSPDGKTLVSAHRDGSLIKWNAESLTKLSSTHGHTGGIRSLSFSPDGQTLASAGADRDVIVWEVETMRKRGAPLRLRDASAARSVAFSPDKATLSAVSDSGRVTLWALGLDSLTARACQAAGRNFSEREWEESFDSEFERACRFPGKGRVSGDGAKAWFANGTVGLLRNHDWLRAILANAWKVLLSLLVVWFSVRLWRRPKWKRELARRVR